FSFLDWIGFSIRDFIHWNAFALECTCIEMYLEYYSIKRFFFLSFGENFVIFLLLVLFVSFGGVKIYG
ncbi:hypothetical protein, partial [Helicobacter pylori]|uniref:hypothetical protein n=1 Tax=Helicobacter pylori TaxID=210 RepID=UPI00196928F2